MTNVEMCKQTLAWLVEHPENHRQAEYICGTTMCVAGVAIMLSAVSETELSALVGNNRRLFDVWRKVREASAEHEQGRLILGLTREQANRLFYGLNSKAYALSVLKEIINEAESEAAV